MTSIFRSAIAQICLFVLIVSALVAIPRPQADASAQGSWAYTNAAAQLRADVDPAVTRALENRDSVVVTVMFGSDAAFLGLSGRAQMAQVGSMREAVLAGVDVGDVTRTYQTIPAVRVRVRSQAALEMLSTHPLVTSISLPPNVAAFRSGADRLEATFATAKAVPAVKADSLHAAGITGSGIRVAVIGEGVDATHPDLAGAVVFEKCILINNPNGTCPNGLNRQTGPGAATDQFSGGTAMAGIIAGRGAVAGVGVAPGATLEVYKITPALPPSLGRSLDDAVLALDDIAARDRVEAVLLSLLTSQTFASYCAPSMFPELAAAVDQLKARDIVVFAGAGTNYALPPAVRSTTGIAFPACLENVISVTQASHSSELFSRAHVDPLTDLAAPGGEFVVPIVGGGVGGFFGSGLAAAIAVGCTALFAQDETSTWDERVARIRTSPITTTDNPHPTPFLQCINPQTCAGKTVTVRLASGDSPTEGNDVIMATEAPDAVDGLGGNDLICGLGGGDTIDGGNGVDTIYAGFGYDIVRGGTGADTIYGGPGNDDLFGQGGNDTLYGFNGIDRLFGQGGIDNLFGNNGSDALRGGTDDDTVYGQDGDDLLFGNSGSDLLYGGEGNDRIRGQANSDQLFGQIGDDLLVGGGGNDVHDGGPDFDRCLEGASQGLTETYFNCEITP